MYVYEDWQPSNYQEKPNCRSIFDQVLDVREKKENSGREDGILDFKWSQGPGTQSLAHASGRVSWDVFFKLVFRIEFLAKIDEIYVLSLP